MANLVQTMAGPEVIVRYAHMELAEPSIPAGVRSCVEAGATELVVFPYMLSPGKHSTGDIPRMVAEATQPFPELAVRVTSAFGVHEKLAEVILGRAGLLRRAPDDEPRRRRAAGIRRARATPVATRAAVIRRAKPSATLREEAASH